MKQNYEYIQLSYANDLRDAQVPKFQRSLVWNKQKKLDLLQTLHKNFPFGALLVSAADNHNSSYRILDGQQRLSTIKDYEQHKMSYWKELNEDRYNAMFDQLNQIMVKNSIAPLKMIDFDRLFDANFDVVDFTYNDDDQYYSGDLHTDKRLVRTMLNGFLKEIDEYINLNTLLIPVIKFQGDEADLPEVYENLNRGGVPLTKYEVLNASWSDEKIVIPKSDLGDEILNNVKKYYNQLREKGTFEIENFSEDDITNSREIDLSELSRAMGMFTIKRMPALLSGSNKLMNEIGFGILGIITGVDNKKIATIHNQSDWIQEHVATILEQLNLLARKIDFPFEKLLKQNIAFGNHAKSKKTLYANGLTTTFKILSYFASLWNRNEKELKQSLDNLPAYYVFDYFNKSWNAHGDQRLFQYYEQNHDRNYLTPVDSKDFNDSFKNWLRENEGVRKTFSKEVKALITIHSNLTYLARDLPASEDYEFEHVIPKARILANDSGANVIHMSNLGNGMFLPKSLNDSKNSATLYEFTKDDNVNYDDLIRDADYFSKEQFKQIFTDLDVRNFAQVNNFIDQRATVMAEQIIKGLDPANKTFYEISSPNLRMNKI